MCHLTMYNSGCITMLLYQAAGRPFIGVRNVPSHQLKQYWLIISEVLWPSPGGDIASKANIDFLDMDLKISNRRLQPHPLEANALSPDPVNIPIMAVPDDAKPPTGGTVMASKLCHDLSSVSLVMTEIGKFRLYCSKWLTSVIIVMPLKA